MNFCVNTIIYTSENSHSYLVVIISILNTTIGISSLNVKFHDGLIIHVYLHLLQPRNPCNLGCRLQFNGGILQSKDRIH